VLPNFLRLQATADGPFFPAPLPFLITGFIIFSPATGGKKLTKMMPRNIYI
jgi:hypothetical protein